jgi:hypothetical protein
VILWGMATEEQKKNLAEATLRLARAILGKPDENGACMSFADALFECPREAIADVPALLEALCSQEELPDIVRVIDDIHRAQAERHGKETP